MTTRRLRIDHIGLQASLQDFGRFGYLAQGVTRGGPLDESAFLWGNRLLANPPRAAQLEILMGQFRATFLADTAIAVCGAEVSVEVDGRTCPLWQSIAVKAGQQLSIGMASAGLRVYLAIAGGFQATAQLGSVSTVSREHLGGLQQNGESLQAGDEIDFAAAPQATVGRRIGWAYRPQYQQTPTIGLLPGYQYEQFSDSARALLVAHEYQLQQDSNRMGIRLQGPAIAIDQQQHGLLSEGLAIGALQVPPDGQPIVMMHDRQTLGGYPKLGFVNPLDLSLLAQRRPGQTIRFHWQQLSTVTQQVRRFYRFFGITAPY
ncbi:biotin-dependent carboxyltransferase family protein [Idiomarina xiamenensis]|uniref:Allophanate hydrolase subunit 2 n=1 Tax=Idiomarina xiamenensis 10-D-4 TaxID=740709 RepID=K2JTS1_9GAMM|nr:biotin-dependent carboxyltransferase family protein [Idiomarina xiamenensis]EKE86841.1 allophanate hydrolase subunit 2 [Idiomarina xiamenensis 10-D-4]